jgi:hypothetical protein
LSILKPEAGIAGGGEAEKRIGPVADRKNFLSMECAHVFGSSGVALLEQIELSGLSPREKPLRRLKISGFQLVENRQ